MTEPYHPPYKATPGIINLIGEISEWVGRNTPEKSEPLTPRLRRGNRIRTIQASLAIENNSLSLEQVTALIDGKRILGHPREIQEVRNAFAAYDCLEQWEPSSRNDLLVAHKILMSGLVDQAGVFRPGGVGVFRGKTVVHVAPPAKRVPGLVNDLLEWLGRGEEHPLVASCLFHYEFEFIHPFLDGNGRLGRLWQTLILSRWKPIMAYIPVETIVRERQEEYYCALARSDQEGDATQFVSFMLESLHSALTETVSTGQVGGQVTAQVHRVLKCLKKGPSKASDLMKRLKLFHRQTFRDNYLDPAIAAGLVELTQPDSPRSPTQQYRLTDLGKSALENE